MHSLRKFYYENKYKIWRIIAFIVLILISIYVLNNIAKEKNQNMQLSKVDNISKSNLNLSDSSNTYISTNKSAVTGSEINEDKIDNAQKVIDQFITYCNQKEINKAYEMLSDDCKKVLYPDINQFKTLYYDKVFYDSKQVNVENWFSDTYKIEIINDIMSTGKTSGTSLQDYYTIIEDENGNKRLNINNFVKTEKINTETEGKNIKFNVLYRNIYIDYEEYTLNIENNNKNKIILDSKKDTKSVYVLDKNEIKYYSYSNELLSNLLSINNGFSTQMTIKFIKSYSSTSQKDKYIVFSDVQINNQKEKIYVDI